MITDRDMRNQIAEALGAHGDEFDINGIFDKIHRAYGLVHLDTVDTVDFWRIVARHDLAEPVTPVIEPEMYCGTPTRFYLTYGPGPERQVTKAEWVAAERSAGFHGGRPGEPSTGGFGSGSVSGSIRTARDA